MSGRFSKRNWIYSETTAWESGRRRTARWTAHRSNQGLRFLSAFFSGIENIPFFRCGTEHIDLLLIRAMGVQAGAELEIGSDSTDTACSCLGHGQNPRQLRSHGAWSAEHGAELRFACGSLGITSFLQRCHQVFAAGDQHTGLCPLVGAPFALAGAFGRLGQIVAVLFTENAALLSILPEEAVPAICRAGNVVADTVHRDGQNFFHR